MDLSEQELCLQVAHRGTETTVRSGTEGEEGKIRTCRDNVLVVEPHRVVAVGVWTPPPWIAVQGVQRYPNEVSATYAVPTDAVVDHREARQERVIL